MSQRTSFLAKPPAGTPINCSDPICHRLKAFIPFWGAYELNQPLRRVEDVVRRVRATPSSVNCLSGPWGIAADISPSDEGIVFPAVSATPAAECYMLAFRTNTSAISYGLLGLGAFGGIAYYQGNGKLQFRRGTFNYAYFNSWPAYCDGLPHVLIVQVPGGAAGDIALAEAYVDGVPLSIWSALTSGAPGTITSFVVGQTTMGSFPGALHAVAMWSRTLKAEEIARLSADPFAVFRKGSASSLNRMGGTFFAGYDLFRGVGDSLANVDFSNRVARFAKGSATGSVVGLGHAANTKYTYVLRPIRDNLTTPNVTCRALFETDGSGNWVGSRPAAVEVVSAEILAGGQVKVSWHYRTPYGKTVPDNFGVYYATGPCVTPGNPQATTPYAGDGPYSHTFTLTHGQTYWFAVTARTATGVESDLSQLIGPRTVTAVAPAQPTFSIETTF